MRLSRGRGTSDFLKMLIGTYPFRCQDCNGRFFVNVFLLSRLAYAQCPKCLSLDVTNSAKGYRPSTAQRMMLTFGARRVRCKNCRFMFVSFRPVAQPGKIGETLDSEDQQATSGHPVPIAAKREHEPQSG